MDHPIPFIFISSQEMNHHSLGLQTDNAAVIIKADYNGYKPNISLVSSDSSLETHTIMSLSPKDNLITLSDGSQWQVSASQIKEIEKQHWSSSHHLTISPAPLFSKQRDPSYTIENQELKHNIIASLHSGPDIHFSPSQHVFDLDFLNQLVFLEDAKHHQSSWKIDPSDYPLFQSWHRGHDVIIGTNRESSKMLSRFNKILINAKLKHYVRASQQI